MLTLEPTTFDVSLNVSNVIPMANLEKALRKVYTKELTENEEDKLMRVLIATSMTLSFRTNGNLTHTYAGIRYQGSLVKRIAKLALKCGLPKPSTQELGVLGQELGEQTSMTLYMELAKFSNWTHGAFENSITRDVGACWWKAHNSSRIGLVEDPNGYSVLLYASDADRTKYSKVKGIGRCWLYRFDDGMVIFNSYGTYSLSQIAHALAQHFDTGTRRVKVISNAYINAGIMNNEGRTGGYEGVGYWIGEGDHMTVKLPDLRHKQECVVCNEHIVEDDGKYFAENDSNSFYCINCIGPMNNCDFCGIRYRVNGKGNTHDHCATCIRERTITCAIHGNVVSKPNKAWHGGLYCDRCHQKGVIRRCSGCKRMHHMDNMSKELYRLTGDYRCIPCTRKIIGAIKEEIGDPR